MLQFLAPFSSNLSGLILCPLLGSIILFVIPDPRIRLIRSIGLCTSLITFLYSLLPRIQFENSTAKFQFVETIRWLPYSNINFYIGWSSIKGYKKEYMIAFLICESFMIAVFRMPDLLSSYVFSESVLIPMLCGVEHLIFAARSAASAGALCRVWGSRQRKIQAAYQFFLYTLLGSVFMLLAILFIFFQTGTTYLQILLTTELMPMVPVHIWLPEAHVEAPTAGSVILAGILSKLGTYGFLRFSIP
uniref:NADH-ubiquinone oxidoreductase chain 4 n=1 Tax=Glycine max TaxID=3847 RepID=A0A0R0C7N6_SOYBN